MNGGHPGKSQAAGLQSELAQAFHVLQVRPHSVHRLHAGGRGGVGDYRAGINQVPGLLLAPQGQAQFLAVILGPKNESADPGRRGGNQAGVAESSGAFNGDQQTHRAAGNARLRLAGRENLLHDLDLLGRLYFGQYQPFQTRTDHGRQVGIHALVPDGIDPHVPGRGAERGGSLGALLHLIQSGGNLTAGRVLFRGCHAVFNIQHDGIYILQRQGFVYHALPMPRHKHPGTEQGLFLIHLERAFL